MSTYSVGQELPATSYIINRALLVGYAHASGDQNPIHQNEEFAKSVGLENVIAHGMFTMALVGRFVSALEGIAAVKEFSARFVKPIVVPANSDVELIVSGKVLEVGDSTVKIEISAICADVKVLGMAKALIRLS